MAQATPKYDYLFVCIFAVTDYSGWRVGQGRQDFADLQELKKSVGYLNSYFKKLKAKIHGKIDPSANDIREEVGRLRRLIGKIKENDPTAKIGVFIYIAGHGDQEKDKRLANFFARRTDNNIESNQLETLEFQNVVFRSLSEAHHVLLLSLIHI